jgi:hypothetical protein
MAQTPLHVSAGYNRAEIVKFLLDWQGLDRVELEAKNMVGKINVCMCLFVFPFGKNVDSLNCYDIWNLYKLLVMTYCSFY